MSFSESNNFKTCEKCERPLEACECSDQESNSNVVSFEEGGDRIGQKRESVRRSINDIIGMLNLESTVDTDGKSKYVEDIEIDFGHEEGWIIDVGVSIENLPDFLKLNLSNYIKENLKNDMDNKDIDCSGIKEVNVTVLGE